jgi:A/G-specific adenine glycosylase
MTGRADRESGSLGSPVGPPAESIDAIQHALLAWYDVHGRDLPWRRTQDPYAIWVSEVMLQQTRVETGLGYYQPFLARFPSLADLARARPERVLKAWEGLGYYARARHLHQAAREALSRYGGLPDAYDAFLALPGVGAYTAAAVWAIAFGEKRLPLDGNVRRVLARLFDLSTRRDDEYRAVGEPLLARLRRPQVSATVQALMELGALVCLPRRPHCEACPVGRFCRARTAGTIGQRPWRAHRRRSPHHPVAVICLQDAGGRVLLARRPAEGFLGGLWELPGGKIEAGEGRADAIRRELREELSIRRIQGLRYVGSVDHAYSHFSVTLHLFLARTREQPRVRCGPVAARWVDPARIAQYPLPRGTQKVLELCADDLQQARAHAPDARAAPGRRGRGRGRSGLNARRTARSLRAQRKGGEDHGG